MDNLKLRFSRLDAARMPDLWAEIERRVSATALERVEPRHATRAGIGGRRLALLLAVAAVLLALAAAYGIGGPRELETPRLGTWPGLTDRAANLPPGDHGDPIDTAPAWVDIVGVRASLSTQPRWWIELADSPPDAETLDPSVTVISYGIVLETTGDDAPDYVVGLSNEAPRPGDFRAWVTDLASGLREEQIGPPYGFPVEFRHPDEDDASLSGQEPEVFFTFLGSLGPGRSRVERYYAWSTLTEKGVIVAWDYAPDNAWVGMDSTP